ncbi:MAG TPA: (2Fe-2S) ferredoxin domain-containing protein [Planctomycetes bacterium]|nr:(2Fe-2S) ferredoxin domain-containing protein [Planctomycetota bacterium]
MIIGGGLISRPYEKVVLVCIHGRTCPRQGSLETCEALREAVSTAGLTDKIRIVKSGCLAQCGHGPMVAIEPDGSWYGSVTAKDAEELFSGPILCGTILERLRHQPKRHGKNVIAPDQWTIPPSKE